MERILLTGDEFTQLFKKIDAIYNKLFEEEKKQDRVYSNNEVIQLLKISLRTLQTYRDTGVIDFSQRGKKITYTSADINEYLQKYRKAPFKK